MSQLKLTADSGGGTVAIKAPASTTGNAALDLTVPGTASATLDTLKRAGNILQVVQNIKTDISSQSVDIAVAADFDSLYSQAITPSSSSSKILVSMNLSIAMSAAPNQLMLRLRRKIGSGSFADLSAALGDTDGSRYRCFHCVPNPDNVYMAMTINLNFLDSPSTTDAVTYSFSAAHDSGSTRHIYINRDGGGYNHSYTPRPASTIILKEVAA